jgi:two-component system, chemotaxis family, chemotaxis protein CheY
MKTLIVEDDLTSRLLLEGLLSTYGEVTVAVNGNQAVDAVRLAWEGGQPFDLILLDIMMPEMDGHEALVAIRNLEEKRGTLLGHGVKVVMTTVLSDKDHVMSAFRDACDGYLVKPVDKARLVAVLGQLGLD